MVNMGWVPKEQLRQAAMNYEPIQPIGQKSEEDEDAVDPFDGEDIYEFDKISGMIKFNEESEEDFNPSTTEIEGIVRKGEHSTLFGKQNFEMESYNYIDLEHISKFFNVFNLDSCSRYYIERIVDREEVEEQEEGEAEIQADMYPLPSSRKNIDEYAIKPDVGFLKTKALTFMAAISFLLS